MIPPFCIPPKTHFQLLHFLMIVFNGHFKDGTKSMLDFRFFAAVFLFVCILISIERMEISLWFEGIDISVDCMGTRTKHPVVAKSAVEQIFLS